MMIRANRELLHQPSLGEAREVILVIRPMLYQTLLLPREAVAMDLHALQITERMCYLRLA